MTKNEKRIYDCIVKVAGKNTDFQIGFDHLFGFMAENPESKTTKLFLEYHEIEMDSPVTGSGKPCFTYLIGERFIPEDWVAEEDLAIFQAYAAQQK